MLTPKCDEESAGLPRPACFQIQIQFIRTPAGISDAQDFESAPQRAEIEDEQKGRRNADRHWDGG